MRLADLPTPCLVLDRAVLQHNLARMAQVAAAKGVTLRPHMKTAKSIDVARLATGGTPAPITVSTLAEAEYFASFGYYDQIYAVGITPQKLEQVAKLNAAGASIAVITDDLDAASALAAHPAPIRALIEIDCGEGRGGVAPDGGELLALGAALGGRCVGVLTHAGHSYAGRSAEDMAAIAEVERAGAVLAAQRLRDARHVAPGTSPIVSVGSTPTVLHAAALDGVTDVRAGVYMFGDLFQMQIGSNRLDEIAVTVLASVIGRRPAERRMLIDAGGLALSKDRSTAAAPNDYGFGLVLDVAGQPSFGGAVVRHAYQEHGVVDLDPAHPEANLPVGGRVRVAPNHTCMTVAAHDRYYVVDGSDEVVAVWTRVNGW